MSELTSCSQQMQSTTDILMERNSDRRTATQISQMQQMMAKMEMHLQQVCTVKHLCIIQKKERKEACGNAEILMSPC